MHLPRKRDYLGRSYHEKCLNNSAFVRGDACCTSTRDNAYIIVYLQFLPRKNHSALASSFVSSLVSSLVSSSFSSPLVSARAGSGSLGGAALEDNSALDFWALSKAFLKSSATEKSG